MRGLRASLTVLLLVAFVLGVPLHNATAHGMAHAGGTTIHATHVHGKEPCCPESHAKCGWGKLCQMACSAAVAVLAAPAPSLGARFAYPVRFAAGPLASTQGAIVAPDPFPPKPSRIA